MSYETTGSVKVKIDISFEIVDDVLVATEIYKIKDKDDKETVLSEESHVITVGKDKYIKHLKTQLASTIETRDSTLADYNQQIAFADEQLKALKKL